MDAYLKDLRHCEPLPWPPRLRLVVPTFADLDVASSVAFLDSAPQVASAQARHHSQNSFSAYLHQVGHTANFASDESPSHSIAEDHYRDAFESTNLFLATN